MKITAIDLMPVALPRDVPPGLGATSMPMPVVVVRVRTDCGIDGIGHTLALSPEYAGSLAKMVEELGEQLIGMDPSRPEQIHAKMLNPANWFGPGGLLNIAAAALDIAVWDIIGKDAGQPLWRLLGGFSDRARVYDSGSLISFDIDDLQRRASDAVARGHRAIKMRPGRERHGRIPEVVAHVAAVREAIGFDVDLMLDINQTWTPSRAIQAGHALEHLELFWIEDPTLMHDIDGQAAIAAALDTPIASGEYHYDMVSLLRLLKARAVDYLMADLLRMGGITQFRKVAGMAEAFGVPVVSHIVPEVYGQCIAAVPNGAMIEGMPWSEMLFKGLPEFADGQLIFSERPGHGLDLDEAVIQKYRVS